MTTDRLKTLPSSRDTYEQPRDPKVVALRPKPQQATPPIPYADTPDDEPPPAA